MRFGFALLSVVLAGSATGATVDAIEARLAAQDERNDAAWRSVADRADFEARRAEFRSVLRSRLGYWNVSKTPLNARQTGARDYGAFRVEKILFESTPGGYVSALVFLPDARKFRPPYAGFVFIPGHTDCGKASPKYLQTCELGARQGLASVIYDPLGQGERAQGAGLRNVDEHVRIGAYAVLLGESSAACMLNDAIRAVDYLASRSDVDRTRLGVVGQSGGGTLCSYVMAVDDRIRAAAPTTYLSTVRDSLFACGPQDAEQNFFGGPAWGFNHAALVLSAGCPVLVNAAVDDFFQVEGARATFGLVKEVAAKAGLPADRYELVESPGPHTMSKEHRERAIRFLLKHLTGADRPVVEDDVTAIASEDCTVTPEGEVSRVPGFRSVYDRLAARCAAADVSREHAAVRAKRLVRQELGGADCRGVLSTVRGEVVRGRRVTLRLGGTPSAGDVTATLFASGDRLVCRTERKGKVSHYEGRGDDEAVAVDLYLEGRSLVALRAAEILAVAAELARRTGRQPALVAEGRWTVPALFARTAEPAAFAEVRLENAPKPFQQALAAREPLAFADSGAVPAMRPAFDPLAARWTFGAHEPYAMYRRVGRRCTGGIDGNARWLQPWLDWFDAESPKLMEELGLNWLHSRFYKGMGWEVEKKDLPNVQKFVRNCHAHGVRALAYVQFATFYPETMRNEIPDVESWAQVDRDGKPQLWGGQYFRYQPCLNCRAWEDYLAKVCVRALTEGGFDGIMFDNAFNRPCYCPRCEKAFAAYLASLPDKAERFGFDDLSGFRLPRCDPDRIKASEVRDPAVQAWARWRADTTTAVFARLAAQIRSVKGDAVVAANASPPRRPENELVHGVDMVALSGVLDLIIGQSENYPSVDRGCLRHRIRDLKLARELATPIVSLCDTDAMMTPEQERHYLLPLYEDAAFGGVPTDRTVLAPVPVEGFVDRAKVDRRKERLAQFNAFVAEKRAAFEAPAWEPVRLFYPTHEMIFSGKSQRALCAAEEILTRRQVPWGYLVSTPARPCAVPAGTEVIVVAGQLALSQAQVDGLVAWAEGGGRLVVTGDAGRYDEFNGQRLANPLLARLQGRANVVCRAEADVVTPAALEWKNRIGVPEDHGAQLLADLRQTGWTPPFTLAGCPETVALDVRRRTDGRLAFHLVNFDPGHPVSGAAVVFADGHMRSIPDFEEYALVED